VLVWTRDGETEALDRLEGLILQELNVKSLAFVDAPESLMTRKVLPDFRNLGRKYGKRVPKIQKAIAGLDGEAAASHLESQGFLAIDLDGESVELTPDEVRVETEALAELAIAEDDAIVVAVDTGLNDELADEGLAREFVHTVQNLRKASGLDVADRIEMVYDGSGRLEKALERHADYIRSETLCVRMEKGRVTEGDEHNINGEPVRVSIKRAGAAGGKSEQEEGDD
jgi:isoleucyl-tRNA synthetase